MEKNITVSEMLRQTAVNTADFMNKIADHIEQLEQKISEYEKQIKENE